MIPTCQTCGQPISLTQKVKQAIKDGAKSVSDIKRKMPAEVDDKEIYNALGYLTRHKKIKRTGYGTYTTR